MTEKVLSPGYIARVVGKSVEQTRRDLDRIGCVRDVNGKRLPTEEHLRQLQKQTRKRAG